MDRACKQSCGVVGKRPTIVRDLGPLLWRTLAVLVVVVGPVACGPTVPPAPTVAPSTASGSDWDQVLAAARREGSVAVAGPDGDAMRDVLTQSFEKQYGIKVEYLGDPGPGIPPRVTAERGANQYLWDVFIGGTTTALTALLPANTLDPIDPALLLADVKDPKTWRGGGLEYLDDGHRVLVMTPFQRGTIFVNPNLVSAEAFTSYKDLLDPKWKGKIVLDDPRKAGPGQATFTFFYLQPDLGASFIRALGQQEITIIKNFQQEVDMLGQGKYPILLGGADFIVEARAKQGVPVAVVDPRQLKEGSDVSPANGAVGLFNRPPHPNAAKVYLNWLLSKDEQTDFARVNGYVSSRLDVPTDHAPSWRIPSPGAIRTYDARAIAVRDTLVSLLEEVFGKA
jgi:iron(III) transport system substrate-binding protein